MNGLRRVSRKAISPSTAALLLMISFLLPGPVRADATELLNEAVALYRGEETSEESLRTIRSLLDGIVSQYPESDLAVQVMMQATVGGLEIAAIDARLAALTARVSDEAEPTDDETAATALFEEARLIYQAAATLLPDGRGTALLEVRRLLDEIIDSHSTSNLALQLAMQMPINGLDPAALDREIADASLAAAQTPTPTEPALPPPDATTEDALGLDRQAWCDIQARLLVSGFDPNGVDGQPGAGTRGALAAWQIANGLAPSGFLDLAHLDRLIGASRVALDQWLSDPDNRALHTPPPPIALTVANLGGTWSFTATCGRGSPLEGQTFTGTINIGFDQSGAFAGSARNSQGFNGRVAGTLSGRTIRGEINWGLLIGRVGFSAQVANYALSLSGSDTNGCRLTAQKT